MARKMRLDLSRFQKQRVSGAIVITAAIIAVLLAAYFLVREQHVAEYYLQSTGHEIPNMAVFERIITNSKRPVAVMFESPTCPACAKMRPYWRELEKNASGQVEFYHVMLSPSTRDIFMKYRVEDTPTFIVFVNGKPVARHIGIFIPPKGMNVTEYILTWVYSKAGAANAPRTPRDLALEGLRIYNQRCAVCHGRIEGLDKASLEKWLNNAVKTSANAVAAETLVKLIKNATRQGILLHQLYDKDDPELGFSMLSDAVESMKKYVPNLMTHEVRDTAYLLDYITAVLEDKKPPVFAWMKLLNETVNATGQAGAAEERSGNATRLTASELGEAGAGLSAVGLAAAATAAVSGVIAVFSPCVLPLLLTQLSVVAASGRRLGVGRCVACGVAAAAGILAFGALFLAFGGLVSSLQRILLPVVAAAVVAAGAASLLGVPVELQGLVSAKRGGLMGFCALYGFLAVQCNLPIVIGALFLVLGLGLSLGGVLALVSLAAGVGIPLAIVMWLVSRGGAAVADKLLRRNELLTRVGGAVMLAAGLYLLLASV